MQEKSCRICKIRNNVLNSQRELFEKAHYMNTLLNHWWGFAQLPDGVDYPTNGEDNPLTLVCQFEHGNGLLSVFADLDYFLGDVEAESGHMGEWDARFYKVLYTGKDSLHEHEIRYADGSAAVPLAEPLDAPSQRGEASHILGEPECFTDEVMQDWPGYKLLLQLDENDAIGLRFYDCGSLFFLIREEDFANGLFERTKCALYSY